MELKVIDLMYFTVQDNKPCLVIKWKDTPLLVTKRNKQISYDMSNASSKDCETDSCLDKMVRAMDEHFSAKGAAELLGKKVKEQAQSEVSAQDSHLVISPNKISI